MSFSKKTLTVSIALAEGTFDGTNNQITLPAVPISATIDKTGGTDLPKASLEVKNLSLATMQRLTVLAFRKLQTFNNVIRIEADDNLVFQGEITSAVPEFQTDGTAIFKIEAASGYYPLQLSETPVSVQGDTAIEKLMEQFATNAGYTLKNEGVEGSVSNCVFYGSPIQKARQLAKQAGIDLLIDNGALVILPSYSTARDGAVPLFSKDSGLIGYPSFTNDGIHAEVLFSPLVEIGGMVKIESVVPKASGVWRVDKVSHRLQANDPAGGEWTTSIDASWLAEE